MFSGCQRRHVRRLGRDLIPRIRRWQPILRMEWPDALENLNYNIAGNAPKAQLKQKKKKLN